MCVVFLCTHAQKRGVLKSQGRDLQKKKEINVLLFFVNIVVVFFNEHVSSLLRFVFRFLLLAWTFVWTILCARSWWYTLQRLKVGSPICQLPSLLQC